MILECVSIGVGQGGENKENFSINLSFAGVRVPCLLHRVPDDIGKAPNGLAIPSVIHFKAPT